MTTRPVRIALAALLLTGAAACSSSGGGDPLAAKSSAPAASGSSGAAASGKTVVVGSANFPENVLLASIYAQALKAKGVKVEEKFNIGSREVLYGQVQSGALTVLPEYNGALLGYLDAKSTATGKDAVNTELKAKL